MMACSTNVATLDARVKICDADYVGTCVAWNDGSRGVTDGVLSYWGKNVTDARIVAQDGGTIPFVRPQNLDETLGVTTADKIEMGDGTTLQTFLCTIDDKCKYRGDIGVSLNLDGKMENIPVVVRAQYAWVPVEKHGCERVGSKRKVVPAHLSYQTQNASDPKNLLVLGTPSGVYVHTDKPGINKLFAHTVNEDAVDEHWFAVESSDLKVGCTKQQDMEVDEENELQECVPTKKSKFVEIGIKGMGLRANTFVVVSIPNKQTPNVQTYESLDEEFEEPVYRSLCGFEFNDGVSSSAIISADTDVAGKAAIISKLSINRPPDEPIVVTILMYAAIENVQGRKGNEECDVAQDDVRRAIDDIKSVYAKCDVTCKLSQLPAMLHELQEEQEARIVGVKRMSVEQMVMSVAQVENA